MCSDLKLHRRSRISADLLQAEKSTRIECEATGRPQAAFTRSVSSPRGRSLSDVLQTTKSRWRLHFETTTPNFNLATPYAEMLPRSLTTCKGVESRVWRNYTSEYLTGRILGFIEKHVEYYFLFLIRKFLLEFIIIDIIFSRRMNLSKSFVSWKLIVNYIFMYIMKLRN